MLIPHNLSEDQLGLMLFAVLPAVGGLICLYNAYRMGKLKWKPQSPADPRGMTLIVLAGILLAVALLVAVG